MSKGEVDSSFFLCLSNWASTLPLVPLHQLFFFLPILELLYGGHLLVSSSVLPSLEWFTGVVLGITSGSTSHMN